jgi:copper chaperone CopZ
MINSLFSVRLSRLSISLFIGLSIGLSTILPRQAVLAKGAAEVKKAEQKMTLLRVDWQVTGSSCATCLIRLEKKLRATPGVRKVVVSIFKPFNAALVYEKDQTSWTKIKTVMDSEKVGTANLKEATISDLPLVLEPR